MADLFTIEYPQRQVNIVDATGRLVPAMEVTAKAADGTIFSETIPLSMYNAETVAQILTTRAQAILDIAQL